MDNEPKDLFRTRDHVADFDRYMTEYASRSEQSRARHRTHLDISYGDDACEKLDIFLPHAVASSMPVHLFIHGGYWRMFSKNDFSFIADTVVASGGIAAIMDYALMPTVRMTTIVDQVRRAAAWLLRNAASYGGDATRLTISGHSAGAHLCCSLLEPDSPVAPRDALLVSGIYDLAPLRSSFLQPLLGLTDEEVVQFSPVHRSYRPGGRVELLVGALETAPFAAQAQQMEVTLVAGGVETGRTVLAGGNHMSGVLDLGDPETAAGRGLARLVRQV